MSSEKTTDVLFFFNYLTISVFFVTRLNHQMFQGWLTSLVYPVRGGGGVPRPGAPAAAATTAQVVKL